MPCYRCGARQIDPSRDPSTWTRGVLGGAQVLVCADCQEEGEWTGEVDRCGVCGSVKLLRVLGETLCKGCGALAGPVETISKPVVPAQRSEADLSAEVAAALDRVLRRGSGPTR
jgi:hypothetical protein